MSTDAPQLSGVERMYRAYIDEINARKAELRAAHLAPFVHEHVMHNGRAMDRSKYATLMTEAYVVIPDLHFTLNMVTINGDSHIGARILFDKVHTTGELFGAKPGRSEVTFAEHVFYSLRDGRIAEVHSLLDWNAFKAA